MAIFNLDRPATTLKRMWSVLRRLPGGKGLFSRLFGWMIPYSGTIRPEILDLGPGLVRVRMCDRKGIRNHLKSAHAMALANLAEASTGLALMAGLGDKHRAILTGFSMRYLKKGRGDLTGVCRYLVPPNFVEGEVNVEGTIENEAGEVVAEATATWRVGLNR